MLLEEITSGDCLVGEVLPPEQIIATRRGGRTALREAVSRVKGDGIVQSKQGRGLTIMQTARPSVLRIVNCAGASRSRPRSLRRSEEDLAAMRRPSSTILATCACISMRRRITATAARGLRGHRRDAEVAGRVQLEIRAENFIGDLCHDISHRRRGRDGLGHGGALRRGGLPLQADAPDRAVSIRPSIRRRSCRSG